MVFIPEFVLRSLFKKNSLHRVDGGTEMALENNLAFDLMVKFHPVELDGKPFPAARTRLANGEQTMLGSEVSASSPFKLVKGSPITVFLDGHELTSGVHRVKFQLEGKGAGLLKFEVKETAQGV